MTFLLLVNTYFRRFSNSEHFLLKIQSCFLQKDGKSHWVVSTCYAFFKQCASFQKLFWKTNVKNAIFCKLQYQLSYKQGCYIKKTCIMYERRLVFVLIGKEAQHIIPSQVFPYATRLHLDLSSCFVWSSHEVRFGTYVFSPVRPPVLLLVRRNKLCAWTLPQNHFERKKLIFFQILFSSIVLIIFMA